MLNALLVLEILVCGWDTMVLPNPIGNLMLEVNGGTPYTFVFDNLERPQVLQVYGLFKDAHMVVVMALMKWLILPIWWQNLNKLHGQVLRLQL